MHGHTFTLQGLKKLHAELGGKIVAHKVEGERLAEQMRHIEAVIKMLDPAFNIATIAPKRRNKPSPYFKKGKCFQHVLGVLRGATAPMTANEIITTLLHSWGVTEPKREAVQSLFGAVNGALRRNQGNGVERVGNGRPDRWVLR